MPKATEEYNLLVKNPGLAKEWHPTKNGILTPMNVTPGSGKRVWWICTEGHEWEAPIYKRSRGSDCPICGRQTHTDDFDAAISHTNLLKEWHPTKNSGLNPRDLPQGFNKKVWWICEEGHEWKNTIKSRMTGKDCPVCNKGVSKKSSSRIEEIIAHQGEISQNDVTSTQLDKILQTSFSQTGEATGFRKSKRYSHHTTVIVEEANSGSWSYAQSKDFSNDGMSLESEVAFKVGAKINIRFDTQPFKSAPKFYTSIVRWCRELTDEDSILTFGVGVKFI
jgi:endogenous inhibitor of DNA gyrase (YacG/DUF329 family)